MTQVMYDVPSDPTIVKVTVHGGLFYRACIPGA